MGGEKRRTVSLVVVGSKLICTDSCCGCKSKRRQRSGSGTLATPWGPGDGRADKDGRVGTPRFVALAAHVVALGSLPCRPGCTRTAARRRHSHRTRPGNGANASRRGGGGARPLARLRPAARRGLLLCGFVEPIARAVAASQPAGRGPFGTSKPAAGPEMILGIRLLYQPPPPALRPGPAPSSRSDF